MFVFLGRTWHGGHRPTFNYKTPTYNHLKPTNCFSEIGRKIGLNGSKVVSQRSMLVFTTVDARVHNDRYEHGERSMLVFISTVTSMENDRYETTLTLTDFTLHFSCSFTKLLYSKFIPLLNNFTMQEKCY